MWKGIIIEQVMFVAWQGTPHHYHLCMFKLKECLVENKCIYLEAKESPGKVNSQIPNANEFHYYSTVLRSMGREGPKYILPKEELALREETMGRWSGLSTISWVILRRVLDAVYNWDQLSWPRSFYTMVMLFMSNYAY